MNVTNMEGTGMSNADLSLCYLSATDVLDRFRAKSLSPVDYLQALIARAQEVEPTINAFAFEFFDEALNQAKLAEAKYASGADDIGRLEGLPVAIKDETDVAGQPLTAGSLYLKNNISTETNYAVQRLLNEGAIIHARTATGEFCCSATTDSILHGTTHTPWKHGYTCGGSSGGSAASLAAGTTPLATGSDVAGSIRIPAACCGIVGYKPPHGRNPVNTVNAYDTYYALGPMTRTVGDTALMQNVMCGPHPLDDASLRPAYVLPDRHDPIAGLKIAWSMDLDFFEVDEHVRANTRKTLDVFQELGAELLEVEFGWSSEAEQSMQDYFNHLYTGTLREFVDGDPSLATPWARYCADASRNTTVDAFRASYETQVAMARRVGAILDDNFAFICPAVASHDIPADHQPDQPVFINNKPVDRLFGWYMCHPFNMLGRVPILSVPSGIGANGLPTGIQIAARHLDDSRVFRIATALEQAQPWLDCQERRPTI